MNPKKSNQAVFVVLVILVIAFSVYLLTQDKTSSDVIESKSVNIPDNQEIITPEPANVSQPETSTTNAETNPAAEEKTAALKAVEEKLKTDPNNDLLKSQRDVLLNTYLSNPNQDTPKE